MHCGLCVWLQVAEAARLPTPSSAAFAAALVHAVATVNASAIITAIHSCRHHSRPSPTTPWSEPAAEPAARRPRRRPRSALPVATLAAAFLTLTQRHLNQQAAVRIPCDPLLLSRPVVCCASVLSA